MSCGTSIPKCALSMRLSVARNVPLPSPPRKPPLLHSQNDLEVFRLRGREREILASPGPADAFLVIVVQKWSPSSGEDYAMTLPVGAGGGAGVGAGAGAAAGSAAAGAAGAGASAAAATPGGK